MIRKGNFLDTRADNIYIKNICSDIKSLYR